MAEVNHSKDNSKSSGKEIGIGTIFLLLILAVFIIWVITGGPQQGKNKKAKLFEKTTYPVSKEVPSLGSGKIKYYGTAKTK